MSTTPSPHRRLPTDEFLSICRDYFLAWYGVVPDEITARLPGRPKPWRAFPPAFLVDAEAAGRPAPATRTHSSDFRAVAWDGQLYEFTVQQSAAVKLLWEAMENGTHLVSGAELLEAAECESGKVSDLFRRCRAWKVLIVEGDTQGAYRLAE